MLIFAIEVVEDVESLDPSLFALLPVLSTPMWNIPLESFPLTTSPSDAVMSNVVWNCKALRSTTLSEEEDLNPLARGRLESSVGSIHFSFFLLFLFFFFFFVTQSASFGKASDVTLSIVS